MHEVLVNRLGGLSLPRKSVVRLTDRLDMTLDVFTVDVKQQYNNNTTTQEGMPLHDSPNRGHIGVGRFRILGAKV